jgi:hypothetical protein
MLLVAEWSAHVLQSAMLCEVLLCAGMPAAGSAVHLNSVPTARQKRMLLRLIHPSFVCCRQDSPRPASKGPLQGRAKVRLHVVAVIWSADLLPFLNEQRWA